MAGTKYTMLGMSSAGKTCYITAMYMKMAIGFDGFTLVTDDKTRARLDRDIHSLRNPSGQSRFPVATNEITTCPYEFTLNYNTKNIISFELFDYAGGVLLSRENTYEQIKQSIAESTVLYIFIDGKSFCTDDREERKENVEYDCAVTINPIIQDFADSHNGAIPPIVFVVTKADLCKKYVTSEEIVSIIQESFSPAFAETNTYICAVSLGDGISDDNYKGKLKPVNVHIPFFIGSYHEYYNRCVILKNDIEKANKNLEEERADYKSQAEKEKRKLFLFRDDSFIDRCRNDAINAENGKRKNQQILDNTKKLYHDFSSRLEMESSNFIYFINGVEQKKFRAFEF